MSEVLDPQTPEKQILSDAEIKEIIAELEAISPEAMREIRFTSLGISTIPELIEALRNRDPETIKFFERNWKKAKAALKAKEDNSLNSLVGKLRDKHDPDAKKEKPPKTSLLTRIRKHARKLIGLTMFGTALAITSPAPAETPEEQLIKLQEENANLKKEISELKTDLLIKEEQLDMIKKTSALLTQKLLEPHNQTTTEKTPETPDQK